MKDLSCLLPKLLSTIKNGLVRYCNTKTSCNGVSNMWILKNSTSLLSSLNQLDVRTATSVQTFDFSTLYTSIPHNLLKSRISNLVHNPFRKKDGSLRYTHNKVARSKGYFIHDINGGGDNMYTADNVCSLGGVFRKSSKFHFCYTLTLEKLLWCFSIWVNLSFKKLHVVVMDE